MMLLDMILPAFAASLVRAREQHIAEPANRILSASTTYLSPRELQVAQFAAKGLGDKEIARELAISPTTVRTHLDNAFKNWVSISGMRWPVNWGCTDHGILGSKDIAAT